MNTEHSNGRPQQKISKQTKLTYLSNAWVFKFVNRNLTWNNYKKLEKYTVDLEYCHNKMKYTIGEYNKHLNNTHVE